MERKTTTKKVIAIAFVAVLVMMVFVGTVSAKITQQDIVYASSNSCFTWVKYGENIKQAELVLNNGIISLTLNDYYEHNLTYEGTKFMEYTGGGETWTLRILDDLYGHPFDLTVATPMTQISPLSASAGYSIPGKGIAVKKVVTLSENDKYYDVRLEITNNNDFPVGSVKLYQYMEPNVDDSNEETAAYDTDYDLIYGFNEHYLGFSFLDCLSSKHDISLGSEMWSEHMLNDTLNNQNGPIFGDSFLTEESDIGTINAGETVIKTVRIAVGDSLADIERVFGEVGPTVSIYTDAYTYSAGDTMEVGLDVANPGAAQTVRFAVWLEKTDGGTKVVTYTSVDLPEGLNYSNSNFMVLTLPSISAGTYTWHAALIEPSGPIEFISHDIAEWEFVLTGTPTEDITEILEQTTFVIDFGE